MNDIYQEHILDHANNPRNYIHTPFTPSPLRGASPGEALNANEEQCMNSPSFGEGAKGGRGCICGQGDNPSCGDEGVICVWSGPLPWGRAGEGVEYCIENVKWHGRGCAISQASMSMMSEYIKGKSIKELKLMMPGDVYQMLGIQITPSRVNCALLPYRALENILSKIML